MLDTSLERLIRRDKIIVSAALVGVTLLSWLYVLRLAAGMDMGGMDMTGWQMISTGLRMAMRPAQQAWTLQVFLLMFIMWTVMMVGMMTPSVAPIVLLYVSVRRRAVADGKAFASTSWFAGGYLLAWTGFSLIATLAQWMLERGALLTPAMAVGSRRFGGILLMLAGLYQWSPLKQLCLAHCQSPLSFLQHHGGFQRDARMSLALGMRHGIYCLGCCWALMILLFAGGIMNVTWIAGLAVLVLLEKIAPTGRAIGWIAGIGLFAAGAWFLLVPPR